jgi:hypothetical protein
MANDAFPLSTFLMRSTVGLTCRQILRKVFAPWKRFGSLLLSVAGRSPTEKTSQGNFLGTVHSCE